MNQNKITQQELDRMYDRWCEEQAKLCPSEFVTGGSDPYSSSCRLERNHDGPHVGSDPLGGPGVVRWEGGGSCAGDSLPYRNVQWVDNN